MSIELLLIIFVITYWAAVSFAYWWGYRARDRQRPPGGSYGAPPRRGSNPPSPNTKPQPPSGPPKPEFPPGRVTDVHGRTIGYRSINYPDPSPDRRPTNPFNGEHIPDPSPRKP